MLWAARWQRQGIANVPLIPVQWVRRPMIVCPLPTLFSTVIFTWWYLTIFTFWYASGMRAISFHQFKFPEPTLHFHRLHCLLLITTLTPCMSNLVRLNCLINGDVLIQYFTVEINNRKTFADLRKQSSPRTRFNLWTLVLASSSRRRLLCQMFTLLWCPVSNIHSALKYSSC